MRKIQFCSLLIFALIIGVVSVSLPESVTQIPFTPTSLNPTASKDPDLPDPLTDDASVPEWYGVVSDYYYITDNASPLYYHVIWTHAIDPGDAFDVFLYSDPAYSSFMIASVPTLSWVVARPSTNQKLYPTIHTYGDAGDAYTEWEVVSTPLVRGDVVSGILNHSEFIETYWVSLTAGYWYNLSLTVPPGADFALYLYYVTPGYALGGQDYLEKADGGGVGADERLFWEVDFTGAYAIVLRTKSGAGSYTFEFQSPEWQYSDSDPVDPVLIAAITIGVASVAVISLVMIMRRRKAGGSGDVQKVVSKHQLPPK